MKTKSGGENNDVRSKAENKLCGQGIMCGEKSQTVLYRANSICNLEPRSK